MGWRLNCNKKSQTGILAKVEQTKISVKQDPQTANFKTLLENAMTTTGM